MPAPRFPALHVWRDMTWLPPSLPHIRSGRDLFAKQCRGDYSSRFFAVRGSLGSPRRAMACPRLVRLVVPPVPLAAEHQPPLAQLIPLISEDVLSSTRIPKRGERCSAPLILEMRMSWGRTGPRGCSRSIPVPLPPGEHSSAPIPERSHPPLVLPLCFRGCVYQHDDPHRHLPCAAPLPAGAGTGLASHTPLSHQASAAPAGPPRCPLPVKW